MRQDRTVTRDELYRQVWAEPMETVAKAYGITGRGLSKICDRLDVPYPYRGYWAGVRAGQHAAKYQLRPAKPDTPESVVIFRLAAEDGQGGGGEARGCFPRHAAACGEGP